MREVTLYSLTEKKVLISNDYLEVRTCNSIEPIMDSDEFIVNKTFNIHRIPVRKYMHVNWEEPLYVCWDMDVQKLLDLEIDAQNDLDRLKKQNEDYKFIVQGYKNLTVMDHLKIIFNKLRGNK